MQSGSKAIAVMAFMAPILVGTAPKAATAQMAVIDQTNLTQAIEAVSTANKTLAEIKEHTTLFNKITRGIGTGGLGALSNIIGLRDSGLGDLLNEARGMCYAVNDLLNTNLSAGLPRLTPPDFGNGCAGFNWAGETFFTAPPELDPLAATAELRRRRSVFLDANIQQGVNSGMTHRERVKDTAATIAELRAEVEEVQASEDSTESSLRHAITLNSLIQLHVLEEIAALRELQADALLIDSSSELAGGAIGGPPSADGDGSLATAVSGEDEGGGDTWVPPGLIEEQN